MPHVKFNRDLEISLSPKKIQVMEAVYSAAHSLNLIVETVVWLASIGSMSRP